MIRAARKHLTDLEEQAVRVTRPQLDLFAAPVMGTAAASTGTGTANADANAGASTDTTAAGVPEHPLLERLRNIKPDELTPRAALDALYALREEMDRHD